jgi:hypothetical protein
MFWTLYLGSGIFLICIFHVDSDNVEEYLDDNIPNFIHGIAYILTMISIPLLVFGAKIFFKRLNKLSNVDEKIFSLSFFDIIFILFSILNVLIQKYSKFSVGFFLIIYLLFCLVMLLIKYLRDRQVLLTLVSIFIIVVFVYILFGYNYFILFKFSKILLAILVSKEFFSIELGILKIKNVEHNITT